MPRQAAASSTPTTPPSGDSKRRPTRPLTLGSATPADESPILQLQRSVRRQQAFARNPREDLVWQPKFAYTVALVILGAFVLVTLPLWIVLYREVGTASNNGPEVADVMALVMMLLGGFLTCAAAWVIIIEMRGRVRMVDTLAKTGEREAMATPEIPVLDAPLESVMVAEPVASTRSSASIGSGQSVTWDAEPRSIAARAEAQQISAAQTLEASSKLLSSFGGVMKSFGQLPAQVAMLAVALALFVGATVLSLH